MTDGQLCSLRRNMFIGWGRSPVASPAELGVSAGPCQVGFWLWRAIQSCQHPWNEISALTEREAAEGRPRGREDDAGLLLLVLTFIHGKMQLVMLRQELFVNTRLYLSLTGAAGRKSGSSAGEECLYPNGICVRKWLAPRSGCLGWSISAIAGGRLESTSVWHVKASEWACGWGRGVKGAWVHMQWHFFLCFWTQKCMPHLYGGLHTPLGEISVFQRRPPGSVHCHFLVA